jgi:hypothetical protein
VFVGEILVLVVLTTVVVADEDDPLSVNK